MFDPCIFCFDTLGKRAREHVVQRGLGGSLILEDEVCYVCNSERFSPCDTYLIRFLREILCCHHPDVKGKPFYMRQILTAAADGGALRIGDGGESIVPAHILFKSRDEVKFGANGADAGAALDMLATVIDELSRPDTLRIRSEVAAVGDGTVVGRLVRSRSKCYLLQARTTDDERWIRSVIDDGGLARSLAARTPRPNARHIENPPVSFNYCMEIGKLERALAKTALGFVAATWGAEIARQPGFDRVRRIALGYEMNDDGTVDLCFGKPENPYSRIMAAFAKLGHHTVTLAMFAEGAVAHVCYYQVPFGVVRLSTEPMPGIDRPTLVCGLFDYKHRTHRLTSGP